MQITQLQINPGGLIITEMASAGSTCPAVTQPPEPMAAAVDNVGDSARSVTVFQKHPGSSSSLCPAENYTPSLFMTEETPQAARSRSSWEGEKSDTGTGKALRFRNAPSGGYESARRRTEQNRVGDVTS